MIPQPKPKPHRQRKSWWSILRVKERCSSRISKVRVMAEYSKQNATLLAMDFVFSLSPAASKLDVPSPPLPDLLKTSLPPSDSERVLVEKAIQDAEAMIVQLDEILCRVTESGRTNRIWEAGIRRKIREAETFIQVQQSILSPLRRFPVEIFQEIFLWVVQAINNNQNDYYYRPFRPSLLYNLSHLSHVCRYWRTIVQSTSSLWCRLPMIELRSSDTGTTNHQIQYVKEFLRYVRQAPLDIIVDHRTGHGGDTHPVIGLLLAQSNQWRRATFVTTLNTIYGFHSLTNGRLNHLEHLQLELSWIHLSQEEPTEIDAFESAPRLKSVSFSSVYDIPIKLPFGQIVEYSQEFLSLGNKSTLLRVLSGSPLQILTIVGVQDNMALPPTTLHHLVKLQIGLYKNVSGDILDSLTLPSVKEIRIVSSTHNFNLHKVVALLTRSGVPCRLNKIYLRLKHMSSGDLSSILEATPGLEYLDTTISKSTADIMNLCRQDNPLVPYLETCRIFFGHNPRGISQQIAQAINSLAEARCELKLKTSGGSITNEMFLPLSGQGQIRPLKYLSVYWHNVRGIGIDPVLSQLEGWSSGRDAEIALKLEKANRAITTYIPETTTVLGGPIIPCGTPANTPFHRETLKLIEDVLSELESSVDQIRDPMEIYVQSIHVTLSNLGRLKYPKDAAAENEMCRRSNAIVEKWNSMFLEHLQDRRWAFDGRFCATYVSRDDDIRTSSNALDIVYGLERREGTEHREKSWVQSMINSARTKTVL